MTMIKSLSSATVQLARMKAVVRAFLAMLVLAFSCAFALAQDRPHPVDPLPPASCLSGDAKVTCGRIPGTFVITLTPSGVGGVMPTSVQVTSLTPGVSIVSPASNYPVIGGQVKITVAGVIPGQTISLQVDGTAPQAEDGLSVCCNGTIKVTIPRGVECPKPTIDIVKVCEPAVMGKYAVSPVATGLGLHANCTITVKTTGVQTGTISVGDQIAGSGTVVNMTAPAPWTCTTPACSVNGASLNPVSSTTVIGVTAVFANTGDAVEAKQCATVAVAGRPVGESCVPIVVREEGKLTVTKEASHRGDHITNVNFPIAVTCGSSVTNATVADGTPYVQGNIAPGTQCSVVEGTIPPTGRCERGQREVWTTTYTPSTPVTVTAAGATIKVRNILECKDDASTITVTKTCSPVEEVVGAINSFVSNCTITVTTTGPQTGTVSVGDSLTGGGTVTSITSQPSPVWTCTASGCSIPGNQLNQTSSTSVFDVKVTFPTKGHATESENCAGVSVDQAEKDKDCTGFTVGGQMGRLEVKKVALHNGQHITGPTFPISVTCGGITNTGTVSDGSTFYTPGNILVGSTCTVVETPGAPPANLCPAGTVGSWSVNYSSPGAFQTVTGLTSITITNTLVCRPVTVVTPPPSGPKCDPASTVKRGDGCVCRFGNAVKVSPTACACPRETKLNPRNGRCEKEVDKKVCGKGTVLNPRTQKCDEVRKPCGPGTVLNTRTGKCNVVQKLCRPPLVLDKRRNRCVEPEEKRCDRGEARVGNKCIEVPTCGRGEFPVPGTNRCVRIGGDDPRGDKPRVDRPRGDKPREDRPREGQQRDCKPGPIPGFCG